MPGNVNLAEWRQLIHRLNRRYHQEWERAERLQAELRDIHGSRAWRFLVWLRRLRRWVAGSRVIAFPSPDCAKPAGERSEPAGLGSTRGTHVVRPAAWPKKEEGDIAFPLSPQDLLPSGRFGRVSIIIPFKDQVGLLRQCLRSLRQSTYRRFEVVLVNNGSEQDATYRFLARLQGRRGVTIIDSPEPFNFSRLCNQGAKRARGSFLLFLNNDVEVLSADWLEQLLRVAHHPHVGIVGATLLYPNGRLQHAGIFPQPDGSWFHPYRDLPGDHPGEQGELQKVRTVPAVTGACLLIRKKLFIEMGGFREDLPVTHNDVDLCQRIKKRGLLAAITPHARLMHYESLSRGYAV